MSSDSRDSTVFSTVRKPIGSYRLGFLIRIVPPSWSERPSEALGNLIG